MPGSAEHWDGIYAERTAAGVSWFQPTARLSLELVRRAGIDLSEPVIDVGAGASTFVDGLLAQGHRDVTLLDLSETAMALTRQRVGQARAVTYVVGDVLQWRPSRQYALWHDRAVFHFLVKEQDRAAYRSALAGAVAPGGKVVIATFDLTAPPRCSDLPVRRYSATTLVAELSDILSPLYVTQETHTTPWGSAQPFVFALFERIAAPV